jgi:hypothetical protein
LAWVLAQYTLLTQLKIIGEVAFNQKSTPRRAFIFYIGSGRPSYNLHEKSGSKSISVVTAACFVGRLPGPVCHAALFEGQIGK